MPISKGPAAKEETTPKVAPDVEGTIDDSKLKEFARTRGLDWPARGVASKATKQAVRDAFKLEWDEAGKNLSVARKEAQLQQLRDKAWGHLVDYTQPKSDNPTSTTRVDGLTNEEYEAAQDERTEKADK